MGKEEPVRWLTADRDALHAAELRAETAEITPVGDVTPAVSGRCTPIAASEEREVVDVAGMLRAVTLRPHGTSLTMEADLWDGTGNVTLIWLGRREIAGIQPGRRIVVHGRLTSVRGERAIYNPTYELRPGAGDRSA
jgi:RecG-like helicase